jgi:hypothetical protein
LDIIGRGIKYLLDIERQTLRKVFGPIHCKEGWKIRSNKEMQMLIEIKILLNR